MEMNNEFDTKLGRLTALRNVLHECCCETFNIPEEWRFFHNILDRVNEKLLDEMRRLGYMAVYPIVGGCAQESLFVGTMEHCKEFIDILLENDPSMKGNIIVTQL